MTSRASASSATGSRCSAACFVARRSLLQQVRDETGHFLQVAQQGFALRVHLRAFGQQLGVEPRTCERAAQLVADGEQQRALGVKHLLDVLAHGVDGGGKFAQFVGAVQAALGNGLAEVSRTEAASAFADGVQRLEQTAHVEPGQQREHEQRGERVADQARAAHEHLVIDTELDGVPVGGVALQDAVPVFAVAPFFAVFVTVARPAVIGFVAHPVRLGLTGV
jgi:hypothetical protein